MAKVPSSKDTAEVEFKRKSGDVKEIIKTSNVLTRSRNRTGYSETLEKLRKEFYDRWEKNVPSGTEGLKDFEREKTLGTGSFGRVIAECVDRPLRNPCCDDFNILITIGDCQIQEFLFLQVFVAAGESGMFPSARIVFGRQLKLDPEQEKTILDITENDPIFLVQHKQNRNYFAMKVIDKIRIVKLKQVEHTLYEKKILESAKFPFLISLEYSFKDNSYIYLLMPFVNGGEMFTHLRRARKFDESLAKFYAAQVLLALEFLHYCDVIYRDLKPENILIDIRGYLKIADMGFCKIVKGRTWTLCGTPEYIAPEIILSKGYGKAIDWWSYGVLLFEMSAGYPPFTSTDPMKVYEKIISCKYKCPTFFTLELSDLIRNLLQIDLSRRYGNLRNGSADIKGHRWFHHINFEGIYNRQIDPPFKPKVKSPSDTSNFEDFPDTDLRISEHNLFEDQFEKF